MAGVIGGGGLGDLAIRYGYQRFNNEVMFGTVLILVAMVQGCKWPAIGWCVAWPTAASRQSLVPAALCRQLADQSGGVTSGSTPTPARPSGRHTHGRLGFRGGGQRFADIIRQRIIRHGARRIAFPSAQKAFARQRAGRPDIAEVSTVRPSRLLWDRRAVAGVGGRFRHSKNAVPSCTPCAPNCITLAIPSVHDAPGEPPPGWLIDAAEVAPG